MEYLERLDDTETDLEFWAVRCDICNQNIPMLETKFSELSEAARVDVILDLASVGILDSSGIGLLLMLYKRLQSRSIKLMLRSPDDIVKNVLELTAMDRLLPYYT